MHPAFRLSPLALCIGLSLSMQAHGVLAQDQDMPDDFSLCPIVDVVPSFDDAPATGLDLGADRSQLPTDIEGDALTGTDVAPQFEGDVALRRGDQFLGADKLTYDSEKQTYVAEGNVRYQDSSMRVTAERAEGNQGEDRHQIQDLKYQLVSRRGNGESRQIDLQGPHGSLHDSTFTTCSPGDRASWKLKARRIDVDSAQGLAVARSAVLRVGNVPVMYVPWFMFPVDERRRTGLLFPSFSNSDRNGVDYRQPIYFNIAPNYDATLHPRFMTERGTMLGAEFRYLNQRGRGTLTGAYMHDDDLRKDEPGYGARGHLSYNAFQNLTRNWQARANLMYISDTRYFEDFNNSINGIAMYNAYSVASLNGRGRGWNAGLMADHWQLADYTLPESSLPFDRVPRAYAAWERSSGWFTAGIDAEGVRFTKDEVIFDPAQGRRVSSGGSRLDIKPYISMPLEGAAWFLRPTLAWRYTAYQIDDEIVRLARIPQTPTRSLPIASVDTGLYFDRAARINGDSYLQTIEPRLFYLYSPYRDQRQLPVFDTAALTFSWGQLFRDNRYSGADRQADANQLTLALTSRLIRENDGRERLSASFGQIRYFDDSRVVLPGELPIEQGRSAWVADATWAPSDRWTIGASYQWNPKLRARDLLSVRARYLLPDDGIVNLTYRYRRGISEQYDVSLLYPINDTWSVVGRQYYSILDHKPLEQIAGVQWDSCCIAVRLVGRRYVENREGDLSRGIMLEIELKGLGSAGQDTRKTLRRAILGYNRGDLYLVPPEQTTGQPPTDPETQQ